MEPRRGRRNGPFSLRENCLVAPSVLLPVGSLYIRRQGHVAVLLQQRFQQLVKPHEKKGPCAAFNSGINGRLEYELRTDARRATGAQLHKPEIRLYEVEGARFVVKDGAGIHAFIKLLMSRRTQRKEVEVYKRLQGVAGVPGLLGVLDRDAFCIEFIEGETLARGLGPKRLEPAIEDLGRVIAAIHDRRVVHLDLKQKRNVVVKPDNTVAVIDFQSAICFKNIRFFFALLKQRDIAGLIKFKGRYLPDLLTPSESKRYDKEKLLAKLWPFTHLTRFLRRLFKSEKNELD